ncbi:hypothetical protein ACIQWR_37445 [Streptomyces sp. NPDC098789]|uniref:hypothetical protein n=1 Tax=Streptomyces sp. NPDC098789 TaxID=3366098 RepID=UPI00381F6EE4
MREIVDLVQFWRLEQDEVVIVRPLREASGTLPPQTVAVTRAGSVGGRLPDGFDLRDVLERSAELSARRPVAVLDGRPERGGCTALLLQTASSMPDDWWRVLRAGGDAALITPFPTTAGQAASTVVLGPQGATEGPLTTCSPVVREARHLLASGSHAYRIVEDAGLRYFVEASVEPRRLVILGHDAPARQLAEHARADGALVHHTDDPSYVRCVLSVHNNRRSGLAVMRHAPDRDNIAIAAALRFGTVVTRICTPVGSGAEWAAHLEAVGVRDLATMRFRSFAGTHQEQAAAIWADFALAGARPS